MSKRKRLVCWLRGHIDPRSFETGGGYTCQRCGEYRYSYQDLGLDD